jgi:hypothetical protein
MVSNIWFWEKFDLLLIFSWKENSLKGYAMFPSR